MKISKTKESYILVCHIIAPLILGFSIYLLFRNDSINVFIWIEKIGFINELRSIRNSGFVEVLGNHMPSFIVYNLPNGLWSYAFSLSLLSLWDFQVKSSNLLWLMTSPILSILLEVGQFFNYINGTFDIVDLIFVLFLSVLPFYLFLSKIKLS